MAPVGEAGAYNLAVMRTPSRARLAVVLTASLVASGASGAFAQDAPSQPQYRLATPPADGNGGSAGGGKDGSADGGGNGDGRRPTDTSVRLKGLRSGELTVGNTVKALGTVRPFVKGQRVTVLLHRGKEVIKRKTVKVHRKGKKGSGQFDFSKRLVQPGRYSVEAVHAKSRELGSSKDQSQRFHIRYPDLDPGDSGDSVKIFNNLLAALGYVNQEGGNYDSATGRAVLAFHKVNGNSRDENASTGMFKQLAKGRGGYELQHPEAGKHVESDISRQVMVLANGDEVDEIYHISSGAPATPTILGQYNFYWKDYGTNDKGMVHSAYFIRGYATHGFASVPTYPASHGCLRLPIPDALHVFNWIDVGDPIYLYR